MSWVCQVYNRLRDAIKKTVRGFGPFRAGDVVIIEVPQSISNQQLAEIGKFADGNVQGVKCIVLVEGQRFRHAVSAAARNEICKADEEFLAT